MTSYHLVDIQVAILIVVKTKIIVGIQWLISFS